MDFPFVFTDTIYNFSRLQAVTFSSVKCCHFSHTRKHTYLLKVFSFGRLLIGRHGFFSIIWCCWSLFGWSTGIDRTIEHTNQSTSALKHALSFATIVVYFRIQCMGWLAGWCVAIWKSIIVHLHTSPIQWRNGKLPIIGNSNKIRCVNINHTNQRSTINSMGTQNMRAFARWIDQNHCNFAQPTVKW